MARDNSRIKTAGRRIPFELPLAARRTADKPADSVSGGNQVPGQRLPDQPGRAGNEDLHLPITSSNNRLGNGLRQVTPVSCGEVVKIEA